MLHVTRIPLARSKGQRSRSPGRFTHRGVYAHAAAAVSVGTYWAWETADTLPSAGAAVGSAALGATAPTLGGEGRGISCRHAHSLFTTRYWLFWQRVVIGQWLQGVVRKITTRCSLYVSTEAHTDRRIDGNWVLTWMKTEKLARQSIEDWSVSAT